MNKVLLRLSILYLLSVTAVFAIEPELSAQQCLEKMSRAMKSLNYQGTVAFLKNGRIDTMRYFHAIDGHKEQERPE